MLLNFATIPHFARWSWKCVSKCILLRAKSMDRTKLFCFLKRLFSNEHQQIVRFKTTGDRFKNDFVFHFSVRTYHFSDILVTRTTFWVFYFQWISQVSGHIFLCWFESLTPRFENFIFSEFLKIRLLRSALHHIFTTGRFHSWKAFVHVRCTATVLVCLCFPFWCPFLYSIVKKQLQ